eukprot:4504500-Alexandrium_andersonii.AAC.1
MVNLVLPQAPSRAVIKARIEELQLAARIERKAFARRRGPTEGLQLRRSARGGRRRPQVRREVVNLAQRWHARASACPKGRPPRW